MGSSTAGLAPHGPRARRPPSLRPPLPQELSSRAQARRRRPTGSVCSLAVALSSLRPPLSRCCVSARPCTDTCPPRCHAARWSIPPRATHLVLFPVSRFPFSSTVAIPVPEQLVAGVAQRVPLRLSMLTPPPLRPSPVARVGSAQLQPRSRVTRVLLDCLAVEMAPVVMEVQAPCWVSNTSTLTPTPAPIASAEHPRLWSVRDCSLRRGYPPLASSDRLCTTVLLHAVAYC